MENRTSSLQPYFGKRIDLKICKLHVRMTASISSPSILNPMYNSDFHWDKAFLVMSRDSFYTRYCFILLFTSYLNSEIVAYLKRFWTNLVWIIIFWHTVSEHQYHTPSREERRFLYFNHLSKEFLEQMIPHLKALI